MQSHTIEESLSSLRNLTLLLRLFLLSHLYLAEHRAYVAKIDAYTTPRGIIPEIVFSGRSGLGLTSARKSGERGGWKTQLPAFTASSPTRFLNDCASN